MFQVAAPPQSPPPNSEDQYTYTTYERTGAYLTGRLRLINYSEDKTFLFQITVGEDVFELIESVEPCKGEVPPGEQFNIFVTRKNDDRFELDQIDVAYQTKGQNRSGENWGWIQGYIRVGGNSTDMMPRDHNLATIPPKNYKK